MRLLVEQRDQERSEELVALVRAGGVTAGQVMALCFGANPEHVQKVGEALMGVSDRGD